MAGLQDVSPSNPLPAATVDEIAKQATPQYANAAARDADAVLTSALREGLRVYLLDTNTYYTYTGTTWSPDGPAHGVMTSWTPVVVQGATPTLTSVCRIRRTGRWVEGNGFINLTSAGTSSNAIVISGFPEAAGTGQLHVGDGFLLDASATTEYPFRINLSSTTTWLLFDTVVPNNSSTNTYRIGSGANTFNAALASGDQISFRFAYEAAADA